MKILFLSDDFLLDSDVVGGGTIATINLAKIFRSTGHDVVVISASKHEEKCGKIDFDGMKVYRFFSFYHEDRWRALRSIYNPSLVGEIKNIIINFKPDIVLAHNIHMYISFYPLMIARRYAKKVFFVAHDIMSFCPGTFTEFIDRSNLAIPTKFDYKVDLSMLIKKFQLRYFPLRNYFIKKWLNKIDGVIAVSNALRDALEQNGIKTKKVIHNGIDVAEWVVSDGEVDRFVKKFNLLGKNCILFQGRLSGAKGGHLIIQAMKIVAESCPNSILLIAGNVDDYTEKMKSCAKTLGISSNLVFTDWLRKEEIKLAYNTSSLIVVPSVCFDSFPNANLEAFACKKPVVATCFGGSREIVKDGKNGFIVNPFDINSLAKSIIYLIKNPDKAKEYGENGYRLVKEEFSIKKMSKNYLQAFDL